MSNSRIIELEGSFNLRELGGYETATGKTLKWNKVLRSGSLSELTKSDLKFLKKYGLKYVVDLRSDYEIENWPDPKTLYYKIIPLSIYPLDGSGEKQLSKAASFERIDLSSIYQTIVLDDHAQQMYATLFDILLQNTERHQSVLFHCSAGKDRTGIAAALFLKALGVPEETIDKDYLITNLLYSNVKLQDSLTNENIDSYISKMNQTLSSESLSTHIFPIINELYGSFNNYLEEALNIDQDKLERLKELYLEE